jgi:hypothetical protein
VKRKFIIEGFEFELQRCDISSPYPAGKHEMRLELVAYEMNTEKEDWARLMEVIRVGRATVVFNDPQA